jgi:iron complex transport system substrate-binding protein
VIIGAEPDLVVMCGLNEFGPEDLESAGIPTLMVSGYCGGFGAGQSKVENPIDTIYDDIETLGRVLGNEQEAARAVTELKSRVAAVRTKADQSPPTGSAAAV